MENADYQNIIETFTQWLSTLNYAPTTIYTSAGFIKIFFAYLEQQDIQNSESITQTVANNYITHLQTRKHNRRDGALSQSTITGHINAIKRLNTFLQLTNKTPIPIEKPVIEPGIKNSIVLTKKEIHSLYQACEESPTGTRDKAMLNLYYGCGLRRNEGINLNTDDILISENLVFVRHSKTYRQRYIPMIKNIKADLQEYLYIRNELTKNNTKALLLNYKGQRITGQSLYERLKYLLKAANINKEAGLHTLRHSIATHLLQEGMPLEDISRFLGHSSLESTQIYTHLSAVVPFGTKEQEGTKED